MFPLEITTTTVWIRHKLPLSAPPPPDGDKKLRRKIRTLLINATEQEIDEIVQNERARLNLKWCFDEYFGGPIANLKLGEIVTANVFGNVHLAYILDITSFGVTLVSADTLTVLPVVGLDDIYTAEYSPFFHNYLQCQRVYHAQHVLDWFVKRIQRRHDLYPSLPDNILLLPMCDDVTSDWPVGKGTWFTHDVLPQRSQFVHYTEEKISSVPTANITEYTKQPLIILPNFSPISNNQSLPSVHYSIPYVVTTALRCHSSMWVDEQNPVVTNGKQSLVSKLRRHKQLHLPDFPFFSYSPEWQSSKLFLVSILMICLVTVLFPPVTNHTEVPSLARNFDMLLYSLPSYNVYLQPFGCPLLLPNINKWDWFRALAVP